LGETFGLLNDNSLTGWLGVVYQADRLTVALSW